VLLRIYCAYRRFRYAREIVRPDGSSFDIGVLPNRQRAATSDRVGLYMRNLLQQRDNDYFRSALLDEARAELERLRHRHSAGTDVERWSQFPLGSSPAAEGAATPDVACAGGPPCGDPGAGRG
jgi:hypothetical protein